MNDRVESLSGCAGAVLGAGRLAPEHQRQPLRPRRRDALTLAASAALALIGLCVTGPAQAQDGQGSLPMMIVERLLDAERAKCGAELRAAKLEAELCEARKGGDGRSILPGLDLAAGTPSNSAAPAAAPVVPPSANPTAGTASGATGGQASENVATRAPLLPPQPIVVPDTSAPQRESAPAVSGADGDAAAQSLEIAIEATNTMVNGISAMLGETSGVPQKAIVAALEEARFLLDATAEAGRGGRNDYVHRLIGVDLDLYIAGAELASGNLAKARDHAQRAEETQQGACVGELGSSAACQLRRVKVLLGQADIELMRRPENGDTLGAALELAEQASEQAAAAYAKAATVDPERTGEVTRQLGLSLGRARVTLARSAVRLASYRDGKEKLASLQQASAVAQTCSSELEPMGTPAAGQSSDSERWRDLAALVAASCGTLEAVARDALEQTEQASERIKRSVALLEPLVLSHPDGVAFRLEHILARLVRGLVERKAGKLGEAQEREFIRAHQDFKRLTEANPLNYFLRSRYIQLSSALVDSSWHSQEGNSEELRKALLDVLETRARFIRERMPAREMPAELSAIRARLANAGARREEASIQDDAGGDRVLHVGSDDDEVRDLRRTLAFTLRRLFDSHANHENWQAITTNYEQSIGLIDLSEETEIADEELTAALLVSEYWTAFAYRELGAEADTMQVYLRLEERARRMMEWRDRNRGNSVVDAELYRHLFAHAIRRLGEFKLERAVFGNYSDESSREELLLAARERVEAAFKKDSSNFEFRFAFAKLLHLEGKLRQQRRELEEVDALFRRAAELGSAEAAQQLSVWYRTGQGPTRKKDLGAAEQYKRYAANRTSLPFNLRGRSKVLADATEFQVYLLPETDGRRHVAAEIERLKRYYGVERIEPESEAELREIYSRALLLVGGTASRVKYSHLQDAENDLREERGGLIKLDDSEISERLAAADSASLDGDLGTVLSELDRAAVQLGIDIANPRRLRDWAAVALHYVNLSENATRTSGGSSAVATGAQSKAEQALIRVSNTGGFERLIGKGDATSVSESYRKMAAWAYDLGIASRRRGRVSYELNKDFHERYFEIAVTFQRLAIEAARRTAGDGRQHERLAGLNGNLAVYFRAQSESLDANLSQVPLRDATSALSEALSDVGRLIQADQNNSAYRIRRLEYMRLLARTHEARGERTTALRLAEEIIKEAEEIISRNEDQETRPEMREALALSYELYARLATDEADHHIDLYNRIVGILNNLPATSSRSTPPEVRKDLRAWLDDVERTDIDPLIKRVQQSYERATDERIQIVIATPDQGLQTQINANIRNVVNRINWRQKNLESDKNLDVEREVDQFLSKMVAHWRKRVEELGDTDEARHYAWYLARSYALCADIVRDRGNRIATAVTPPVRKGVATVALVTSAADKDCQVAQDAYQKAREQFESIRFRTELIDADYALFLNDVGFWYLSQGGKNDTEARQSLTRAYELWRTIPNRKSESIWDEFGVSDLNIPANYAHMLLLLAPTGYEGKADLRAAHEIYEKYQGRSLDRLRVNRTWGQLVRDDLEQLRRPRLASTSNLSGEINSRIDDAIRRAGN